MVFFEREGGDLLCSLEPGVTLGGRENFVSNKEVDPETHKSWDCLEVFFGPASLSIAVR